MATLSWSRFVWFEILVKFIIWKLVGHFYTLCILYITKTCLIVYCLIRRNQQGILIYIYCVYNTNDAVYRLVVHHIKIQLVWNIIDVWIMTKLIVENLSLWTETTWHVYTYELRYIQSLRCIYEYWNVCIIFCKLYVV